MFIFGLNKITSYNVIDGKIEDKMVAWRLRYWAIKYLGEFFSTPLFLCCTCMASVWGTAFYVIFTEFNIVLYPFYLIILAGINHGLQKYFE
jgi:hypothetical protein